MIADLAARDPQLPVADLLDADRMTDLLGAPTVIERVRYKPGTSLVLGVRQGDAHGWVAAYADPEKLAKTRHRARRSGAVVVDVGGLAQTAAGTISADRVLGPVLRRGRRALGGAWGDTVLRYNPHRRLVVRVGDRAMKVSAADAAPLTARLAEAGLLVLPSQPVATGVQATPWWGDGDLADHPDADAATAAGRALAALHRAPWHVAGELAPSTTGDADLTGAVDAIAVLDPDLGARAERVAGGIHRLPVGVRSGAVHGDFTADQVLVGEGDVRLIDFDRAGLGEPERDLGAFAAGELLAGRGAELTDALRSGYEGELDEAALARWTATAALQRAVEPFRTGDPSWPTAMRRAIDLAADVTAGVAA
ncbi:phosphotransferase [Microbacterium dauci]|uniref:Phosphotransferase n=1 Tax=Microbacterium dauci TaxID=3048008 RepID=A0ABT6ZDN8_9MICO|nr:phosphotransferase [Microbacterium sp. LX3-4]MDJ1114263.1 phosphotransferase [Microbacterium sp. LX3-4]